MGTEQVLEHFLGHAGRGPGRDVARCDDAGVGEAGLFGRRRAALEHRDLVAVTAQFVRGGHADVSQWT